jgi:hypothetical protein
MHYIVITKQELFIHQRFSLEIGADQPTDFLFHRGSQPETSKAYFPVPGRIQIAGHFLDRGDMPAISLLSAAR